LKTRDVIYLIYDDEQHCVTSTGIEFLEFVRAIPFALKNVLLLSSGYTGGYYHSDLRLDYVVEKSLPELFKEDVYSYGDFCWVDFENVGSLDEIKPNEKAEILFLAHYKKPLHSAFFNKLNNKFAYLAHDDGWYNKILYKREEDFIDVLRNIIPSKLKSKYRKSAQLLNKDDGRNLSHMAKSGLLVDLRSIAIDKDRVEIPLYVIGKMVNFDDVNNNMDVHIAHCKSRSRLVYFNHQWMIR
jgi:hypothetical protein